MMLESERRRQLAVTDLASRHHDAVAARDRERRLVVRIPAVVHRVGRKLVRAGQSASDLSRYGSTLRRTRNAFPPRTAPLSSVVQPRASNAAVSTGSVSTRLSPSGKTVHSGGPSPTAA